MAAEQETTMANTVMELARDRGIEEPEELLRRVHEAGEPDATFGDILYGERGGFGPVLDAVLGLSEEEKRRVSEAFRRTWEWTGSDREGLTWTAFGRVLGELLQARGIPPTVGAVFNVAGDAKVDAWKVINRTASPEHRWAGNFKRLADHLQLTPEERRRLRRALEHEEE